MEKLKAAPKKNLILAGLCILGSIACFVFFFVTL